MILTPNYINNPDGLKFLATLDHDKFVRREGSATHGSIFPFTSRFSTLHVDKVWSREKIDEVIFKGSKFSEDVREFYQFIQIQRYEPGDFIVPHQDAYDVMKLHLITLTTSDVDALICQDGKDLIRVPDLAGQKIDFEYTSWHWVNPVVDFRYSLVIGE